MSRAFAWVVLAVVTFAVGCGGDRAGAPGPAPVGEKLPTIDQDPSTDPSAVADPNAKAKKR